MADIEFNRDMAPRGIGAKERALGGDIRPWVGTLSATPGEAHVSRDDFEARCDSASENAKRYGILDGCGEYLSECACERIAKDRAPVRRQWASGEYYA